MTRNLAWGAACAVALVGAVLYGRTKNLDASEWAAWVQAVGSVLAILVAVAVADFHVRSERASQREQQKNLIDRVTQAVRNLGVAAHTLRHFAREQESIDSEFLDRFETYLVSRENAVLGVPLWDVEDQLVVTNLLVLHASIGDCRFLRRDHPPRLVKHLDALLESCRGHLEHFGSASDLEKLSDEEVVAAAPATPRAPWWSKPAA